ncbi:tRNA 2'-phosphotransferase [[Candida] jaroonii]|uniref:tRNA 2'-phosphotransferase n=1 Tax=[Candida] jaroonii TaxID=467808 RepID=A0ACA9YAK9_9ASCO|nr:tRNA 2'-phosphotransferase [[Candida] jaroonii]
MNKKQNEDRLTKISKSLSYLLRHGAVKEKLPIDENGFIELNKVLNHQRLKSYKTTIQDIQTVVETNNKKRFSLRTLGETTFICANQGHSIEISNNNLVKLQPNEIPKIFHGTYKNKLPEILNTGLNKMSRNHIHLTDNFEYIRKSCNALIFIDVEKCLADDIIFYKSENNVYLTEGVNGILEKKYFVNITDRDLNPIQI